MNKKYMILLLISIVCIAMMLSFMIWRLNRSRETEGFNSIKGINSIGLSEESFLEVIQYDDTVDTNPSQQDRRNMYNFKLRKRLTAEGKEVLSVFYLKGVSPKYLCYQDIEDGSDEKWLKFSGEEKLMEFYIPIQYEYIDSGPLKDHILILSNLGPKITIKEPIIQKDSNGVSSKTYEDTKQIDFYVSNNNFASKVLLIYSFVATPDNKGINIYINGTHSKISAETENKWINKNKIVKYSLTKGNILSGTKLTENNIKDEIVTDNSFITDVTIDNERKLLLIYKEGNKFSISISKDLIINQFKRTEDYNTLESLMMGGNIIGIASYNNSIFIVGYFGNKYSETSVSGQTGDDPNRMEMIKLNVTGDEIRIDSIVSLPPEFKGDTTKKLSGAFLNNLFVIDNQIMLHYHGKLLTMVDGSKDPNFIAKPRRAKTSIGSIYKASETFDIISSSASPEIVWNANASSMNSIQFSFTFKDDDVKDKDTILIYGISIKHKDGTSKTNHLIKRFSLKGVDGEASFGFYMNDKTLKTNNMYDPFYFMFVSQLQVQLPSPVVGEKRKIQLTMNIFDVGSLEPQNIGESLLNNGIAINDLNMDIESIVIYYNTFEKGEIDENGTSLGDDRCSALDKRLNEIKNSKLKKLTSTQLKDYSEKCKEEYEKAIPPGTDLNKLTATEIEVMIPKLEQANIQCKKVAMSLDQEGDDAIDTNIIKDIDTDQNIKDNINKLNDSINKMKIKKQNHSDTGYIKGFKDSFTFAINTIKNHIGMKDHTKIYDDTKINEIKKDIVDLQTKIIDNEHEATCMNSDTNLKLNDLVDNIKLYKTYNDIQVKKFSNLYPTPKPTS